MRKLLILSFVTTGVFYHAQSIGNSPYASFGIGDVKYDNTTDTNGMGGVSTAYVSDFSNSFNFSNPAANTNLELTAVKLELTNENNFFKTDYNHLNVKKHSNYISNISIAFPITRKIKFGLGYQPYSSKKYSILQTETLGNGTTRANLFSGDGTLSTVQAAVSYQLTKEFALGLRSNFYFGNLYDNDEVLVSDAELINGYLTKNKVKTFNFTLGGVYQKRLEDDKKLTLGATYTFGNTGTMETYYANSTYFYDANTGTKANVHLIEEKFSNDKQLIPQQFSLGAGFGKELKWFLGAQYDFKKGETIQFLGQPFSYQNSSRMALGGWYVPNINNFRNYFSRVIYRYGAYYEKGQLNINSKDINEMGLSVGASFPFQNKGATRFSGIDVAVEFGKRGTLENNLIRQNFINLKFGINFGNRWFAKTLYD